MPNKIFALAIHATNSGMHKAESQLLQSFGGVSEKILLLSCKIPTPLHSAIDHESFTTFFSFFAAGDRMRNGNDTVFFFFFYRWSLLFLHFSFVLPCDHDCAREIILCGSPDVHGDRKTLWLRGDNDFLARCLPGFKAHWSVPDDANFSFFYRFLSRGNCSWIIISREMYWGFRSRELWGLVDIRDCCFSVESRR